MSKTTYLFLFILLTITSYAGLFLAEYSFMVRIALILLTVLYFSMLFTSLHILKRVQEKLNITYHSIAQKIGFFILIGLTASYLLLVNAAGEEVNLQLLRRNNHKTVATIKDCQISKGTEYCIYSYKVANKSYDIKYCNPPSSQKLKNNDTALVVYYPLLPIISKLKRDFQY